MTPKVVVVGSATPDVALVGSVTPETVVVVFGKNVLFGNSGNRPGGPNCGSGFLGGGFCEEEEGEGDAEESERHFDIYWLWFVIGFWSIVYK